MLLGRVYPPRAKWAGMKSLWVPSPNNYPDTHNLFDMMLVFQEQIDAIPEPTQKIPAARHALKLLGAEVDLLEEDTRQIVVNTKLVVIDSTVSPDKGAIIEDVGLQGFLDDVGYLSLGHHLKPSLTLDINVLSLFTANRVGENDYVLSMGRAPIDRVNYIETLSA